MNAAADDEIGAAADPCFKLQIFLFQFGVLFVGFLAILVDGREEAFAEGLVIGILAVLD